MPYTSSILTYNQHGMNFVESTSVDEILAKVRPDQVSWITLSGITPIDDQLSVAAILEHFKLGPNLLETIFSFGQPLEEAIDDCLYLDYRYLLYRPEGGVHTRISGCFLLGQNFLLNFEKTPSGLFDSTRRRVLGKHTRAQQHGADYLLYLLVRTVLISYQKMLVSLTEKFETIEDVVIAHPAENVVYDRILELREEIKPLQMHFLSIIDLIGTVQNEDSLLVSDETQVSFNRMAEYDTKELLAGYDHLHHWIVELLEIHRANLNENTNHVIKALTIMSSIFLPLTFIAGIYGMNFVYMPGTSREFGFPVVIGIMMMIGFGLLFYLRHKRWL